MIFGYVSCDVFRIAHSTEVAHTHTTEVAHAPAWLLHIASCLSHGAAGLRAARQRVSGVLAVIAVRLVHVPSTAAAGCSEGPCRGVEAGAATWQRQRTAREGHLHGPTLDTAPCLWIHRTATTTLPHLLRCPSVQALTQAAGSPDGPSDAAGHDACAEHDPSPSEVPDTATGGDTSSSTSQPKYATLTQLLPAESESPMTVMSETMMSEASSYLDELESSGKWSVSLDELDEMPDTVGPLVDLQDHPLPLAVREYLTPRSDAWVQEDEEVWMSATGGRTSAWWVWGLPYHVVR